MRTVRASLFPKLLAIIVSPIRKGLVVFVVSCVGSLFASLSHATIIDNGGGQFVWTELVYNGHPAMDCIPCSFASLAGTPGQSLRIVKVGIGGDADATSGDISFRLSGGGLDFTWTAGQEAYAATYDLGATPALAGSARGFTYSNDLNMLALDGASLTLTWDHRFDWDGRYTQASDVFGNYFDDSATRSSARAWIQFEKYNNVAPVPEPETYAMMLAGLGLLGVMARRRKQKLNA